MGEGDSVVGAVLGLDVVAGVEECKCEAVVVEGVVGGSGGAGVEELVAVVESGGFDGFADSEEDASGN